MAASIFTDEENLEVAMSERTHSQVNTGISVREASFVSPSQFERSCLQVPQVRAEKVCYKGRLMLWTARRSRIWQPLKPA